MQPGPIGLLSVRPAQAGGQERRQQHAQNQCLRAPRRSVCLCLDFFLFFLWSVSNRLLLLTGFGSPATGRRFCACAF
jgi:hypothetical protein